MIKNVLITGANGFIGSHLVEEAIRLNYKVYSAVRKRSNIRLIEHITSDILRVDYFDPEEMASIFSGLQVKFDLVVHCAGVTEAYDLSGFREGNVQVTKNLLESVSPYLAANSKFVYFSSLAARGPMEAYSVSGLDSPISDYGVSKKEAEEVVINSQVPHLIVRPTAVYGPRDRAFLELAKLLRKGIEITLGDVNQKLTMIHARDLVRMIFQYAKEEVNLIYGFDGKVYKQKDISNAVKKHLGTRTRVNISLPSWLFKAIVYSMNGILRSISKRNWTYSTEKSKELLATDWSIEQTEEGSKFKPEYSLEAGFADAIEWYRKEGWL